MKNLICIILVMVCMGVGIGCKEIDTLFDQIEEQYASCNDEGFDTAPDDVAAEFGSNAFRNGYDEIGHDLRVFVTPDERTKIYIIACDIEVGTYEEIMENAALWYMNLNIEVYKSSIAITLLDQDDTWEIHNYIDDAIKTHVGYMKLRNR